MVTLPFVLSLASTGPQFVSMRQTPEPIRPRRASVTMRPMVPWPHILRKPTLLKKITPAWQVGSCGWQSSAPTMASLPRGSLTTAERMWSKWLRKRSSRSWIGPLPRSGAPDIMTRVGSPPVWESTTRILFIQCQMLVGKHHQFFLRDAACRFLVAGQDRLRHLDVRLRRIHHVDIEVATQVADEQEGEQRRQGLLQQAREKTVVREPPQGLMKADVQLEEMLRISLICGDFHAIRDDQQFT